MADDNVIELQMVPTTKVEHTTVPGYTFLPSDQVNYLLNQNNNLLLPQPTTLKSKITPLDLGERVVCFDCETSGTNPWEYRFLVCGVWDVSRPKSEIISFSNLDEEVLTNSVLDWFDTEAPDALTGYNMAFDLRCLMTRAMYYQHKSTFLNNVKFYDTMEILQRGTSLSVYSNQPVGSVEDWETYFWDTKKPFTIAECMDALLQDDLSKFVLRNRSCVAGEGDLFNLIQWVLMQQGQPVEVITPPIVERTEMQAKGHVEVQCPQCLYKQDFDLSNQSQICIICGYSIPNPTPNLYLQEYVRPLDYAAIAKSGSGSVGSPGITTATLTAQTGQSTSTTKTATKTKSTVILTASQKSRVSAIYKAAPGGVLDAAGKAEVAKIYGEAA